MSVIGKKSACRPTHRRSDAMPAKKPERTRPAKTAILIVDDHPMLRRGLAALIESEPEVFRLIGQGRGTRQIAKRLHLSIKTIESHREHIKQKLTIESGVELVRRAIQWVETGRTS
jgi:DNA-binding NarL/FixJ family response regulator